MSGRVLRLVCAAAVVAAGIVGPAGGARSAPEPEATELAAPGAKSVGDLLAELQKLYRAAERATETYNTTAEQLKEQTAETRRKNGELARTRLLLTDSRLAAGRLARQQYQSASGFDGYVRLLLAADPQTALDQKHVVGRLARERVETVGRLAADERKADQLATAARKALDKQQVLAGKRKKQRDAAVTKLKAVEKLLASVSADELAELRKLEASGADAAQEELLASGALPGPGGTAAASRGGAAAVRWARTQLGRPYASGASGPEAYDAPGFVAAAWQRAGVPVARTGRGQWESLPKVPLRQARPGDVVVYGPDAAHVALYAGEGKVLAPRPGGRVELAPVAGRGAVLGLVRPDAVSPDAD
ncbi:C40 family peptidase [Streptomyces indicus]|uniref:NlpC/P60 family protein n=1 Tax=Streptomyces indicus TaxID=417292 RepID=A0A1G8WK22_9ACTN|nr:NlpC/P60 family protein [Streptomyces indicus]SDJ78487.1 NlpC/P60 family protein [Streptomyces indicus]